MKNRLAGLSLALLGLVIIFEDVKPGITHRVIHELQQVAKK